MIPRKWFETSATFAWYAGATFAVDATTVLGAGWQHPYNARLATPSMSGGETGRVIITSPTGNRLRFDGSGAGPFSGWPGVNSTLTKNGSIFTQTMRDQSQYLFRDSDGMLTAVRDPQGRQVTLVYNATTPTQLDQIVDASNSTRSRSLSYTSGRISSIADSASPPRTTIAPMMRAKPPISMSSIRRPMMRRAI
jgi:hypothetical protein